MDTMLVGWDGFSRVAATFVFNSRGGYSFSGALMSVSPPLFCVFLVNFCFLLVFYFVLCSSFIFT